MEPPPLGASAFGATLEESWDSLPPRDEVDEWLQSAGIWDGSLTDK